MNLKTLVLLGALTFVSENLFSQNKNFQNVREYKVQVENSKKKFKIRKGTRFKYMDHFGKKVDTHEEFDPLTGEYNGLLVCYSYQCAGKIDLWAIYPPGTGKYVNELNPGVNYARMILRDLNGDELPDDAWKDFNGDGKIDRKLTAKELRAFLEARKKEVILKDYR